MNHSNQNSLNQNKLTQKNTLIPKNKKISKRKKKKTSSQSQQDQFRITKTQYSKLKLDDLQTVKKIDYNPGNWSYKENKAYLKFLKKNKRFFKDQETRRNKTVFQNLSKEIPTRSSEQCRSHHQKQYLKYMYDQDPIGKIIKCFEKKLNAQQFQNQEEDFQQIQKQPKKPIQSTIIEERKKESQNCWYVIKNDRQICALKIEIKLQNVESWI